MSERTLAKNVDNLTVAISVIESIGTAYSPSNSLISLSELRSFRDNLAQKMREVNAALPQMENTVGERIALFKVVPKKVTRILNVAKGSGITVEELGHLKTTANTLRGMRVSAKTPDNPTTPEDEAQVNRSVSQRSFAGILEHLDLLVQQLSANSNYNPNETEFKVNGLQSWLTDLQAKNEAAIEAKARLSAVRSSRDALMDNPENGLLVRVRAFKAYISSILESDDLRRKQISKLKFS
jgi:hypothetical protein